MALCITAKQLQNEKNLHSPTCIGLLVNLEARHSVNQRMTCFRLLSIRSHRSRAEMPFRSLRPLSRASRTGQWSHPTN